MVDFEEERIVTTTAGAPEGLLTSDPGGATGSDRPHDPEPSSVIVTEFLVLCDLTEALVEEFVIDHLSFTSPNASGAVTSDCLAELASSLSAGLVGGA